MKTKVCGKMKHYLYFTNGRISYDKDTIIYEEGLKEIPEKHFPFSLAEIQNAEYPEIIMNYFYSVMPKYQIDSFTFFLSQVMGGEVFMPICLVGEPNTGKTVLIEFLLDIFKPLLTTRQPKFYFEKEFFNQQFFLNNKLFIAESNIYPKNYKKYILYDFKNHFTTEKMKDDILSSLHPDYPNFILYLLFRYEDYIYTKENGELDA
jgi:hypothetical protein